MQIRFDRVSADYQLGPIRAKNIIDHISLQIEPATFTAVIGQTGAGKTSLLKLINGILSPSSGSIQVGEFTLDHSTNKSTLNQVRKRIGMVFQFPENQLFAETVEADIAFGPENFNFTTEEVHQSVNRSLELVGLDRSLLKRSPFSLSGGQQRRVALAGVLATKPDILVLDEPGAGLDAKGKHDIFSLIKKLNQEEHVTVLVVTHDMNDVANYADHVLLLDQGKVVTYQETRAFFSNLDQLTEMNLELPDTLHLQRQIEQRTGINFKQTSLTKTELIDQLIEEKIIMNKLILGRYFPGNSFLHRMDPRAKLLAALYFIGLLFFVDHLTGFVWMICFTLLVVRNSGVSLSIYLKGIKPLIWLILMSAFFRVIFTAGGTIYISKGPFTISSYGLLLGFFSFNRFILIIIISTALTLTTKPIDLTDAIDALLKPLRLLGISTAEFSLMLSISMRFIPNLLDETQKVLDAQRARGVVFGEGNLLEQMKKIVPLIIPLFSSSLKRAEEVADVLEVRGYHPSKKRSSFRQLSWRIHDTASLLIMGVLTIGVIILNQFPIIEQWLF